MGLMMMHRFILALLLLMGMISQSWASENGLRLIMVERVGCHYCERWLADVGPIYPKTEVGQFAPLTMVDIGDIGDGEIKITRPVVFTPTFLVVRDDAEFARLEGFASEDFFWSVLEDILVKKAGFTGATR